MVRKTPQGIEMMTPEMLPKNITTLMNQAASSSSNAKALSKAFQKENQWKTHGKRGLLEALLERPRCWVLVHHV